MSDLLKSNLFFVVCILIAISSLIFAQAFTKKFKLVMSLSNLRLVTLGHLIANLSVAGIGMNIGSSFILVFASLCLVYIVYCYQKDSKIIRALIDAKPLCK